MLEEVLTVRDGETLADIMLADDEANGDAEATLLDGEVLVDSEGVLDCVAPPPSLADGEGELVNVALAVVVEGVADCEGVT
jgi:hypothetical protein